ncbi:MAG: glucose-1-phosphate cytidylyltransferase, partial [Mesorhizobium sp.]
MKLVILAGGLGTRISEESETKPKPMVEIGGRPLLWHIMKIYASHDIREFVICLGYKGYVIKEFFINYQRHLSNLEIDLKDGSTRVLDSPAEDWKVTLIETGEAT